MPKHSSGTVRVRCNSQQHGDLIVSWQPHVDTLGENRRPGEVFDRKHQKAILRRYRIASRAIFEIISAMAPVYEKAGIDEAYLDVSIQAAERLAQMVSCIKRLLLRFATDLMRSSNG